MELTWEEWKAMKKQLRRQLGMPGWTLLIYYGMMNISVFLWTAAETLMRVWNRLLFGDFAAIEDALLRSTESGWGYFPPAVLGLVILLLWKKPRFWREQIWAKGKSMKPDRFLEILCVFLGAQFLSQIALALLELYGNGWFLKLSDVLIGYFNMSCVGCFTLEI